MRAVHRALAAVLEAGVADGKIPRNPARGIETPKAERKETPGVSPEDVERLAQAMPERYATLARTLALTGLRFGEATALRVQDLDLKAGRLSVRQAVYRVNGKPRIGEPKTAESARTISLPPSLIAELREYVVRFGIRQGLVFRSESGGIVDPTNFRRRVWLPAVKHAGLEGLTPHALRHVHARWLIEANQHPKVIAKRLGHSSIQVTFDVYGGLLHGFDEGAAEAIDAVFRNAAVTKM